MLQCEIGEKLPKGCDAVVGPPAPIVVVLFVGSVLFCPPNYVLIYGRRIKADALCDFRVETVAAHIATT